MYKRLLVPLDGSRMAESILPIAHCLAQSLPASITLIHVIEKNAPRAVHGDQHLHDVDEAEAYLRKIAGEWFSDVTVSDTHVHSEEVADVSRSILQHVKEMHSDLTLMCTHGHSGAKQFLYGSIAQQIAAASVPVLLVRATEDKPTTEFGLKRLLVPLDGDPDHEQGLAAAANLATVCRADIHLLTVVPSLSMVSGTWKQSVRLLPGTADHMLGMEAAEAEDYLESLRLRLLRDSLTASCEVLRGDPTDEIVNATASHNADLIVLGTHGTVGTHAFWTGSVAAKVARKTIAPVLLVPAANTPSPRE